MKRKNRGGKRKRRERTRLGRREEIKARQLKNMKKKEGEKDEQV